MLAEALAAALAIGHEPIACMVGGQFPLIEAEVQPANAKVRVYFRAATDDGAYYFVPMAREKGRFVARLPKPTDSPGQVSYYIEAVAPDGTGTQTPATTAAVVKDAGSCPDGGRVAGVGPTGGVRVSSASAPTRRPEGFDGVADVVLVAEPKPQATAQPAEAKSAASAAPAAPTQATSAPATPRPEARPSGPEDYTIGPEDILRIVVYGHDALTQTVVVQPDGTFTFPLVGRVKASEQTPEELQRKLATLLAKDFIRNPQVTVSVQEYRSKTVFVVGEIAKPGTYPLTGNTTVIGILAKAGPTTAGASSEVVIVRPLAASQGPLLPGDVSEESGQAKVMRINIRDIEAGQLDQNVRLEPNDTVFIPQAPTVFVSGEVRNPGAFAFKQGATVRQVVSLAGGFTERSSSKIRVVREVDGKSVESKIGLDDPVRPGDQIIVKAKLF